MRKSLVICTLLLAACGGKRGGGGSAAPENGGDVSAPAALDVETTVEGTPADGAPVTTDRVVLKFGLNEADLAKLGLVLEGYQCKFAETSTWIECKVPLLIEGLSDGQVYNVTVRAKLRKVDTQEVVYAKEAVSTFKVAIDQSKPDSPAGETGNGNGTGTADDTLKVGRGLATTLQIGSAYEVKIPAGLHTTEYSTSKTVGVLSFFRVMPESDPYYLGNFSCEHTWDRQLASYSAGGEALMYCHSTPTREQYKTEHEFRLANNHIEVATDTALVTKESQERLTFSIFDEDYEFMTSRSRFKNVCMNSARNYIDVPMIPNFFLGKNPETVRFWYCDTLLSDVDGSSSLWRVGAFYDIDHMDWDCRDCKYDRAIESVYMVRANAGIFTPAQFAKAAQVRILSLLTKITP